MIITVFILLIMFQLKHFVADFPLQNQYMLGKFKDGWGWVVPLLAHCLVHTILTLGILLVFSPEKWYLCFIDLVIHFIMDRIKAGPKYLGRFKDLQSPIFWWCLGFDQMVHHFTHYFLIYLIIV